MSTAPAATAEKPETKTDRKDIYIGYAGTFDASTLKDGKTKADKPYASATLVVSEDKKVTVSAFSADGIAALKAAVASNAPTIIQGYLADAPGYMNLHKVGASEYTGELANVQSGVGEKSKVPYFDAILKAEGDRKFPIVLKAFGDAATALAGAANGDKLTVEGYAQRVTTGAGEEAGYRAGAQVTKLVSLEPAAKKEAEVDDSPSP
jgi:hypothetical protein